MRIFYLLLESFSLYFKAFNLFSKSLISVGKFSEAAKGRKGKKVNSAIMKNYRPVTIPLSFGKLFEYCFSSGSFSFKEQSLTSMHSELFSTSTALNAFYEGLVAYIDAGECPVGLFCDRRRTFDCVNHYVLITMSAGLWYQGKCFELAPFIFV